MNDFQLNANSKPFIPTSKTKDHKPQQQRRVRGQTNNNNNNKNSNVAAKQQFSSNEKRTKRTSNNNSNNNNKSHDDEWFAALPAVVGPPMTPTLPEVIGRPQREHRGAIDITEPLRRTVHISRVDTCCPSIDLAKMLFAIGPVLKIRICPSSSEYYYAFVEYATEEDAVELLKYNTTKIGSKYALSCQHARREIKDEDRTDAVYGAAGIIHVNTYLSDIEKDPTLAQTMKGVRGKAPRDDTKPFIHSLLDIYQLPKMHLTSHVDALVLMAHLVGRDTGSSNNPLDTDGHSVRDMALYSFHTIVRAWQHWDDFTFTNFMLAQAAFGCVVFESMDWVLLKQVGRLSVQFMADHKTEIIEEVPVKFIATAIATWAVLMAAAEGVSAAEKQEFLEALASLDFDNHASELEIPNVMFAEDLLGHFRFDVGVGNIDEVGQKKIITSCIETCLTDARASLRQNIFA